MLNNEIWKKIQDLPYEVSNLGNVRRDPESKYNQKAKKCVQPYINNKGYSCVNLYKNSKVHKFQVHRLVALGRYTDEIEAAKAYDDYVNKHNLQQFGYSTNFV